MSMVAFVVMAFSSGVAAWHFRPSEPLAILGMAFVAAIAAFLILTLLSAQHGGDDYAGASLGQKLTVAMGIAIVFLVSVIFFEP